MKTLLRLLPLLLALFAISLRAADDPALAAVRAADDERVSAVLAADRARLAAILSPELHYAHSSGHIDTAASLVDAISSKRTVYEAFDYKDRKFTLAGPGIVLMTGRVISKAGPQGKPNILDLNYLAVWRLEGGKWRFLAWQSCKNPEPAAAAPAAQKK